jgi:radical SAM superfamily enzyme YgiQ (UPF0313 family)
MSHFDIFINLMVFALDMKVLLINPPYEESVYLHAPLGLCYVASVLERDGHEVQILDFPAEKVTMSEYRRLLKRWKPDIVGITSMTPHIKSASEIAKTTRKVLPKIKIILGGPHVTILPRRTMNEIPEIDIGILGEGEYTIAEITKRMEAKSDISSMKGTIVRKGKSLKNNGPSARIENLDELPFPARHLLKGKYHKSLGKSPYATMMTSRGCPYSCLFCAKEIFGRSYRARSVENVMDEIRLLKEKQGINELIFFDDSFTLKKDRVIELCNSLIKDDLGIQWKCETRANLVDGTLLNIMKAAGCYLVAYGIESGVQKNLDFLNKGTTLGQIRKAISATKEAGILAQGYFIFGIPGEMKDDMKKTSEFALSLDLDFTQFSLLIPFPGTELYNYAEKNNLISNTDWSHYSYFGDSSRSIIKLSEIPFKELEKIRSDALRRFYMRPGYILGKFTTILRYNDLSTIFNSFRMLAG